MDFTNPHSFKQVVQASFDHTSETYGTQGDFHWAFAQRLVERAPISANETILDVATGTAPASRLAADNVTARGRVAGIDISPGILQHAKQHIQSAGIKNISLYVGDAEHLPFRSSVFDGILCSSSIVWFPSIPQALREWHRVARSGGWIAFSCFGGLARQTINELMIEILAAYGITYREINTPLNSPEKCRRLVENAGFTNVAIYTAQEQTFNIDPELTFAQASGIPARLGIQLSPQQFAQVKEEYMSRFMELIPEAASWNNDYEQFVVAYK